ITFTNNATEEMKTRIIETLSELASGHKNTYFHKLTEYYQSKGIPGIDIQENADKALNLILKDYSSFSISTIESFCQRVIRSFTKELNLPLGYDIEMRKDKVLQSIVDELIMEAGKEEKKYLTHALTDFLEFQIENEKDWKIEKEIHSMADEIFKENYQKLARFDIDDNTEDYVSLISDIKTHMDKSIALVRSEMKKMGQEGNDYIEENGVDYNYFEKKSNSPIRLFRSLTQKGVTEKDYEKFLNTDIYERNAEEWLHGTLLKEKAKESLKYLNLPHAEFFSSLYRRVYEFYKAHKEEYLTAISARKTIQTLRLMNDLRRKLADYRRENRQMMISDTNILLKGILASNEDVPFVYEKLGNRYAFYLIDEFQDTSDMQWENLIPLVLNAISSVPWEGNMIVGDVKQSIYRWRGGAFELLLHKVENKLRANGQIVHNQTLQDNWRTAHKVVEFNNLFFERARDVLADEQSGNYGEILQNAYQDAYQVPQKKNIKGFSHFEFIESKNKEERIQNIFPRLHEILKEVTEDGFLLKDVMILVRKNEEASLVAGFLQKKKIKVTSSESLVLDNSPAVKMLIATLQYLLDDSNIIAAATAAYYYHLFQNYLRPGEMADEFPDEEALITLFQNPKYNLPPKIEANRTELLRLSLYESVEKLIRFFPEIEHADAYIQGLLDTVMGFYKQNEGGLAEFLEWWEEIKNKTYVICAPDPDAVQIMSIHKAKGLEFPVVIMPFCSWSFFPKKDSVFWINSTVSPYSKSDVYPLVYREDLADTLFMPHFHEEKFLNVFDSLNLLYVAFTRPKYRLYGFVPVKKRNPDVSKLDNADKLIYRILSELPEGFDEAEMTFSMGAKETFKEIMMKEGKAESATHFPDTPGNYHPVSNWDDILRIKTHKNRIYKASLQELEDKIQAGNLLHQTLQYINTAADIPRAVSRMILEGLIPKEKESEYNDRLLAVVSLPQVQPWFSGVGNVKNEAEILTRNGDILRPDKIILNGKNAIIIDYKTGSYTSQHKSQVETYRQALLSLGYLEVKCFLYYIQAGKVIEL
ncbi:MAG: UvrD-helicase domain-containing protein, partial [Bacteroidia bacterium]|nr:UvrD-helicase domain-containing protein [Bacteroidia bacterium]